MRLVCVRRAGGSAADDVDPRGQSAAQGARACEAAPPARPKSSSLTVGLRAGVRQHDLGPARAALQPRHRAMALAALERRNDLRDQRTKCVGRGECLHFALAMPGPHHLSLARRRGGAAPPTERRETTFFRGLALSWRLESQRSACWVLGSSGVAPRAVLGTRVRLVRDCAWPLALWPCPAPTCSAVRTGG